MAPDEHERELRQAITSLPAHIASRCEPYSSVDLRHQPQLATLIGILVSEIVSQEAKLTQLQRDHKQRAQKQDNTINRLLQQLRGAIAKTKPAEGSEEPQAIGEDDSADRPCSTAQSPIVTGSPAPTITHKMELERSGIRLMVVEDCEMQLKTLGLLASCCGYKDVLLENSGEAALAHVKAGARPDLVLCDLTMNGIDGVTVLREMRERLGGAFKGTAFVMLSANNEKAMMERCIVEGADAYVVKPLKMEELRAMNAFVARRRQALTSDKQIATLIECIRTAEYELGSLQDSEVEKEAKGGDDEDGLASLDLTPRRVSFPSDSRLTDGPTQEAVCAFVKQLLDLNRDTDTTAALAKQSPSDQKREPGEFSGYSSPPRNLEALLRERQRVSSERKSSGKQTGWKGDEDPALGRSRLVPWGERGHASSHWGVEQRASAQVCTAARIIRNPQRLLGLTMRPTGMHA